MEKYRIVIDGEDLELDDRATIAISKRVNDLSDLQNRQAAFSNQFPAPITANNARILERAEIVGSVSKKPYRKIPAKVWIDGIQVIGEGFMVVEEAKNSYQCVIYSGNLSLFEEIAGRYLSDLDFADLTHNLTTPVVAASRTNRDGYIYGIVDYSNDDAWMHSALAEMYIDRSPPLVFVKTIWDRIFAAAGFAYEGRIFNTWIWDNLLLQMGTDAFAVVGKFARAFPVCSPLLPYDCFSGVTDILNVTMTADGSGPFAGGNSWDYFNNWVPVSPGGRNGCFVPHIPMTFGAKLYLTFSCEVTITMPAGPGTDYEMGIYNYGTASWVIYERNWISGGSSRTFTKTWTLNTGSFTNTDKLGIRIQRIGWPGGTPGSVTLNLSRTYMEAYSDGVIPLNYGAEIRIGDIVPKMAQKDFVKGVMNLLGLFIDTDYRRRICRFASMDDIVNQKPNAQDWTDKIDNDSVQGPTVKYHLTTYAQRNWFRYKEDDLVSEGYGDGYLDVDDETLEEEKDLVTLPFAATETALKMGSRPVPQMVIWDNSGKQTKTAPRILLLQISEDPALAVSIKGYGVGATIQVVSNSIPYCRFIEQGKSPNLGFNDSILRDYYIVLSLILNNVKVVNDRVMLKTAEWASVDHFIPVFIQKYAAYFYINKLDNFVPGRSTAAELIRIP